MLMLAMVMSIFGVKNSLAVLAYVACAYVQPAPDNGVDRHWAEGRRLPCICARQQGVLSHVIGGQHLHLMKGLHCRFTLTQHVLGMQNMVSEKEMRSICKFALTTNILIKKWGKITK